MVTLKDLLMKYNGGIFRGSQKKLAKAVGVFEGSVSKWVTGKADIGEASAILVAKELGTTPQELYRMIHHAATNRWNDMHGVSLVADSASTVAIPAAAAAKIKALEERIALLESSSVSLPPLSMGVREVKRKTKARRAHRQEQIASKKR